MLYYLNKLLVVTNLLHIQKKSFEILFFFFSWKLKLKVGIFVLLAKDWKVITFASVDFSLPMTQVAL